MLRHHLYIFCCISILFCIGCQEQSGDQQPISLNINFAEGTTYHYIIKNNIDIEQPIDGNTIKLQQNMTLNVSLQLLKQEDHHKYIQITYDRVEMTSGVQNFLNEFDSDNDNGDLLYQGIRDVLHIPFNMVIADNGSVTVVQNDTNTVITSDSSMLKVMMQVLKLYPTLPIVPGNTWKRNYITTVGFFNISSDNTYKFVERTDNIAYLELNSIITTNNIPQPEGIIANVKGIQTGQLEIEISSGLIKSGSYAQTLAGTLKIDDKENPVSVNSKLTIIGNEP